MDSMSCRPLDCGIVAAPFPLISFIISDGVACLTCRCPPRFAVSLPSSHHRLVPSSRSPFRPAMLLAWLGGSVPSVISLVISGNLLACLPLCVPPCVPFLATPLVSLLVSPLVPFFPGDVIAVLSDRSPCRSACVHRSPRHACRLGWERDGTGSLSRHRLPALPPLLTLDGVSPACVSSLWSALLACVPPFVSVM